MKRQTGIFLLSIGDEILDGRTQNTNSSYFGEQCRLKGIPVEEIRCVSDHPEDIIKALKEAKKFPLVVCTGGLGPTNDDRTVASAANAFRRRLVQTKASLEHVRSRYERRGLELTPQRLRLASIPARAKVLQNPTGTAPGLHIKEAKTDFFFLPGVPWECRPIFDRDILPLAQRKLSARRLIRREFRRTFGRGESQLYQSIESVVKPLEEKYPSTFVLGVHISFPCIDITMECWKEKGARSPREKEFSEAVKRVDEILGDLCFTHERESLAECVARMLKEKGITLATAESCTGGWLGKVITDIPGSSSYYLGGVVSYANEAKEKLLGVSRSTLASHGAVSAETVKEMAESIRKKLGSDYALAISGISGPSGGSEEKPVGTTYVALSGPKGTKAIHQWILNGRASRAQNREIAFHFALDALRSELAAR